MEILIAIVVIVVSYFFGTFPSAAIVASRKNLDITTVGSGNPGASNVIRNLGWKVGLAVFLMDMAKASEVHCHIFVCSQQLLVTHIQ